MLRRIATVVVVSLSLVAAACSKESSGAVEAAAPPAGLGYSVNPAIYTAGVAIPPDSPSSTGGAVTAYGVTPALPSGLTIDPVTGVITGTPSAVSGATTYTVTASNGRGSATVGLSITVTASTLPPAGLGYLVNPASYPVGVTIVANRPASTGGAVTAYEVSPPLPDGLLLDHVTGFITGTPTLVTPSAVYTVTASNSAGSTSVALAITVTAVVAPPAGLAFAIDPALYTVGVPIAPDAPSSTGGAITEYTVSPALPPGLSINARTGVVSGTPSAVAAAAGYTVTGTNVAGSTSTVLDITVNAPPVPPANGIVSGTVVKGPASGATVVAYSIANGTMAAPIGSATTDAMGNFSIAIGDYAGSLMLQASGGSYADEATGISMSLEPGDVLACAIPSVASGGTTSGIQITPLTTMAHSLVHHMAGGFTAAGMTTANTAVGGYFAVSDILHAVPMNPMIAGSGTGANVDERNHGMAIAAMSQYAKDVGMPFSSGMVTAMADDASDGVMNGMMAGSSIPMGGGMMGGTMMQATAGTSGLATAMSTFVGSAMNVSGVTMTQMQPLVDQLAASNGQLPGIGGTVPASGSMGGTAFMGAMAAGTMTAYAVSSGMQGAAIGSSPVDSSGRFTIAMGSYSGPVMLQLTGGAFVDLATGVSMTMQSTDVLTSCVPSMSAGATMSGVQVTPLTAMAQSRARTMTGGMTTANVTAANTAVGSYFMVGDILMTAPMNPSVVGSGSGVTQDARNHGMAIAAMSEYAASIGMTTTSSAMVTAMMQDASDGTMNGMMGSTPIGMGGMMGGMMMQPTAGTTGLATAMSTYVGSAENRSGVTAIDMQPLVNQLATSSGAILP